MGRGVNYKIATSLRTLGKNCSLSLLLKWKMLRYCLAYTIVVMIKWANAFSPGKLLNARQKVWTKYIRSQHNYEAYKFTKCQREMLYLSCLQDLKAWESVAHKIILLHAFHGAGQYSLQRAVHKAPTPPSRHRQWDFIDQAAGGLMLSPEADIENCSFKWSYKPEQDLGRRKNTLLQTVQDPWICSSQRFTQKHKAIKTSELKLAMSIIRNLCGLPVLWLCSQFSWSCQDLIHLVQHRNISRS